MLIWITVDTNMCSLRYDDTKWKMDADSHGSDTQRSLTSPVINLSLITMSTWNGQVSYIYYRMTEEPLCAGRTEMSCTMIHHRLYIVYRCLTGGAGHHPSPTVVAGVVSLQPHALPITPVVRPSLWQRAPVSLYLGEENATRHLISLTVDLVRIAVRDGPRLSDETKHSGVVSWVVNVHRV